MISAHETVCGQAISSLALASSMRRMIELRHWEGHLSLLGFQE
jgi:hypothetical protein